MTIGRLLAAVALMAVLVACQSNGSAPPAAETGPQFTAQDEAAIRGMLADYVADVLAADWTSNLEYYTVDAVRMPPDAPLIQGHESIRAWWESRPPFTEFTLTPAAVGGDGNVAYARGAFALVLAPPDGDSVSRVGKWQAVYTRQADGSWLCSSDIWNTDTPM